MSTSIEPESATRTVSSRSPRSMSASCRQQEQRPGYDGRETQPESGARPRWPALDVASPQLTRQARTLKLKFMR